MGPVRPGVQWTSHATARTRTLVTLVALAFSTGNIYGLQPVTRGGSTETDVLDPKGDYAMSCLGRERIFEHFSRTLNIPTALLRLNYATELRYGVLVDLAQRVQAGRPIVSKDCGRVQIASAPMTGKDSASAQEITCQPPSRRDSVAPSA